MVQRGGPNIMVCRGPRQLREATHEFFQLGPSGQGTERLQRPIDCNLQGSEIRRYATQFLLADSLEFKAFGGRQDPDLRVD